MVADAITYAERERAYLQSLTGASFLVQLPAYLDALRRQPTIGGALVDIQARRAELVDAFRAHDEQMLPRFVDAAERLKRAVPRRLDDSSMRVPAPMDIGRRDAYVASFANIDGIAARPPADESSAALAGDDHTRLGQLCVAFRMKLDNLRYTRRRDGRFRRVQLTKRVQPVANEIGSLISEHEAAYRRFSNEARASPAYALSQLDALTTVLINPPAWRPPTTDEETKAYLDDILRTGRTRLAVRKALFEPTSATEEDRRRVEALIANLRPVVECLHVGIARELDQARALVTMMGRFKARCEWYDRDRVAAMAATRGNPEAALTAELARFLFDQGFSPLTDPLFAKLRPDLVDPTVRPNLWVECKQYGTRVSARAVARWASQTYNTARRTLGTSYEVRDVFLVIFRHGGPDLELPRSYRAEPFTVYPLLVDVADTSISGSQQSQAAVRVTVDDLAPKTASE